MKKTVLLFALSFVLVAFLSAQNDCGGLSYNDEPKPDNKESSNYHDINQPYTVDCSKPDKGNELDMPDGFMRLMGNSPESQGIKPVYNLYMQRNTSATLSVSPDRGDLFSQHGSILCCLPPSDKILSSAIMKD